MRFNTRNLGRALAVSATMMVAGLSACAPVGAGSGVGYATSADRTAIISVNFDLDGHRIRPEYYASLDAVAAAMLSQQLAGYTFIVDGHTDVSGRLGYNLALSLLRAQAVVDYLSARGVPREVLRPQGFGPLNLLDPGDPYNPDNRRVEVTSVR